jgi:signal transduction histidine kinase
VSVPTLQRPLRRICLVGLSCAVLTATIGIAIERTRFGSSDQEAFRLVERSVRSQITEVVNALGSIAASVSREPAQFDAAAAEPAGARALLDRADQSLLGRPPGVFAVTAYRPSGTWPLAWSGAPSEIPVERIGAAESYFVDPGTLGLRLVYIKPVLDAVSGHRVGVVAAERVLSTSRGMRQSAEGILAMPTVVPVSVRAHNAARRSEPGTFVIASPGGDPLLDARVETDDLRTARATWRSNVTAAVLVVLAVMLLVSLPPLIRWRRTLRMADDHLRAAAAILSVLLASRALLWSVPMSRSSEQIFRTGALGPTLRSVLRSPIDFLLTLACIAAMLLLAFDIADRLRRRLRRHHASPASRQAWTLFVVTQLGAGALVGLLLVAYEVLLGNVISATSVDALHFSLHPFEVPRLAFAVGMVLAQTVVLWSAVLVVRLTWLLWRARRGGGIAVAGSTLQALPIAIIAVFPRAIGAAPSTAPAWPMLIAGLSCLVLAWGIPWVRPRYRHASQTLRLFAGALLLLLPAFVLYPSVLHFADRGLRRVVEEQYAQQAQKQREQLQQRLLAVLRQIDQLNVSVPSQSPRSQSPPNTALLLWRETDLSTERLASSLELYNPDGALVSRFALNLPDYLSTATRWREPNCQWEIFEEASPFGSEERRLIHAGRGICRNNSETPNGGSIVVNVMLDYDALPFITVRSPYYELVRSPDAAPEEGVAGRSVQFVVYGWGRGSLYSSSARAWPLGEALTTRIAQSRQPFWTTLSDGERTFSTYILNDRVGIYVLGYPVFTRIDHLINLAELTALVGLTYAALLALGWLGSAASGTTAASGQGLLREVRASFYRKLFLAFLAAAVVPVLVLAIATRTFFAAQLQAGVRSDAARVASVAQRVVEEYVALQQREAGAAPSDDLMLWLSRAIGQDVNIFDGPQLLATSERDLFESGLIPQRTPSAVYRDIVLDRQSSSVGVEFIGQVRYVLAAAPVRVAGTRSTMLTVPLALRQQEVDQEIDRLDRHVLLAALLFALLGAGIGYSMAERIGDPVNRLTRATRRIARGDFSARVVETSSDELRRLVADFNQMAAELQRQRTELERTHRLEAWAEMARQVAHEIKNPLTPIQLSSEHLVRVNKDRGEPLTPVLEECVNAIQSQVRILRQISAEFSNFASRPTPQPTSTSLNELVASVFEPYSAGLGERIRIVIDVPASLPPVLVDRTLLSRALTNIIENALHAMPGTGSLTVKGAAGPTTIRLSVTDVGTGMDQEALSRIFEPYFSTKATGTGLGLTIAKRNVELNGGAIFVQSAPGVGTTVTIELPIG